MPAVHPGMDGPGTPRRSLILSGAQVDTDNKVWRQEDMERVRGPRSQNEGFATGGMP